MVGSTASALIGVINPVLSKLIEILEKEYETFKDVRKKIDYLREELSSMKTALEMVSESDEASPDVNEWMCQLRELSYDVEDCIDIFMHKLSNRDTGFVHNIASRFSTLKSRYLIANEIKELMERAVKVSDRHKRYEHSSSIRPKPATIDPRLRAVFEEANRLVGIDSQRDIVVARLANNVNDLDPQRTVVSIVGPGGLGKTTLANQIFQKIKSQFDCTAFVSVSRSPNVTKILSSALLQVHESNSKTTADQNEDIARIKEDLRQGTLEHLQLVGYIRKYLQNKRYLVIIDDIWSKQAWDDIQCAFPEDKSAGRIMTTTRIQDVAKHCSLPRNCYVYAMKHLDNGDSKRLFLKRTFRHEDDCPTELKEITDVILRKCDGLPLAIVNIASLLATKEPSKQEWTRVWKTLGSALEHELGVVKGILFLSYYDLPPYLKICLLDLSIFPEDHKISRLRLIRRWMAQGFIEKRGECLEDTGESYISELINRNMIQPVDIDYSGRPRACRVHDIILDLIVSLSTKENFVTVMDDLMLTTSYYKIRRLTIHGNYEDRWQGNDGLSHVRSLGIFGDAKIPSVSKLHIVQVLDLDDFPNLQDSDIKDIGSLIHLRYLSIRNISEIPPGIGNLKHLQTLNLRKTRIGELPKTVVKLQKLVHLILPYDVKLPDGIGKMVALEELSHFSVGSNSPELLLQLGNLIKLKVLDIYWSSKHVLNDEESCRQYLVSSLCKLGERNLRSLNVSIIGGVFSPDFLVENWSPPPSKLQAFRADTSHLHPCFSKLPTLIPSLKELTSLQISLERLASKDMEVLERLPSLLYLKIHTTEPTQEPLTIRGSRFELLKEFHYSHISGGLGPMFEAGAMRRIETLGIRFAAQEKISAHGVGCDFGLSHLPSLKRLWVDIYCQGASTSEVEAAEAAIRDVATRLPNSPIPKIDRWLEELMVEDDQEEEASGSEE